MVNFPVEVHLYCKTCNQKFRSSVFNEIYIEPQSPHMEKVVVKLEELKNKISKEVKNTDGNIIGVLSLKDFEFKIGCPKCSAENGYSIKDLIY